MAFLFFINILDLGAVGGIHLKWLSRNTMLGNTDKDVARYLLTQRLEDMRQADYREEPLSKD